MNGNYNTDVYNIHEDIIIEASLLAVVMCTGHNICRKSLHPALKNKDKMSLVTPEV